MAITQEDVIYFIMTDRFFGKGKSVSETGLDKDDPQAYHGGNFDGIIEKIPYLKSLGITTLWITPVYWQIENRVRNRWAYHGYWTLHFDKVDPHLYTHTNYEPGSKQYFKDLVDVLHNNGIKLMMDVVVNHAGYNHPGQTDTDDNPTPVRSDWFNQKGLKLEQDVVKGELEGLPDFNLDKIDVIDNHIQCLISWIKECGIDGLRMDTAKHIEKGFWNYFKTQIRGKFPEVTLIGEVYTYDVEELTNYQKYWGFDSLFDFPVQGIIYGCFIEGHSLTHFESPFNTGTGILEKDTIYSNHNRLVSMVDNHDMPARFMSTILDFYHKDYAKASLVFKLSLTFLFTNRGIPQIYYGTEIGMEGCFDPDNRRDFPWNKIDSENEVKNEYPFERNIFDHLKKLIQIRRTNPALYAGTHVCLWVDDFIYVFLNYFDENVVITILQNSWNDMTSELEIDLSCHNNIPTRIKDLIADRQMNCMLTDEKVKLTKGKFSVILNKKSAMVLGVAKE